ncbi:MAG TPA: alpha/beta fold hydrolase [Longimicrobiaceae bacterium]|nr:alpha/beta fold hydrolase [Longimicrobiaceae bacterium]
MTFLRAAAAAASVLALAPAAAAQTPERGEWVIRRGGDTLATETYTRTAARLEAELTMRMPVLRQRLDAELSADALVTRATLVVLPGRAGETPPMVRESLVFRGDSVLAEVQAQGVPPRQRFAPGRGALPYVNLSMALLEQAVRRARAMGSGPARIPVLALENGAVFTLVVTPRGADSTMVSLGSVELRLATDAAGRVLGACVPSQGVAMERAGRPVDCSAPRVDYSAPAGAPYRAEEVTVRTPSGVTLAGTLTLPAGAAGRVPAVLLLTGSGPQDRDERSPGLPDWRPFRQVADTLARRGIAVLRLDDRGVGGSGGSLNATTLAGFADDARAALAFLRARPEVDPRRVGIVGHSEGGYVGPMVAAEDPALRALVLVAAPARTGRALVEYQSRVTLESDTATRARVDSLLPLARAQTNSLAAASPWFRSLLAHDPVPFARRLRMPVLVLQGETDTQVPAAEAPALAAAIRAGGNRDVTVRILPAVNHLLVRDPSGDFRGYASLPSRQVVPEALGALADWLAAKLR